MCMCMYSEQVPEYRAVGMSRSSTPACEYMTGHRPVYMHLCNAFHLVPGMNP